MAGRQRINLYFTDAEDEQLYQAIANYAAKQKRSMSQTAKLLIIMTSADQPQDITARLDDIDTGLEELGSELDLIRTIQNANRRAHPR